MIKNLHIIHNDKFTHRYIDFINQNFDSKEHYFLIFGGLSEKKFSVPKYFNIKYVEKPKVKNIFLKIILTVPLLYYLLLRLMIKSEKFYFHSLFDERMILFLFIFKKFLKKSYWVIWGGDLYCYKNRKNNFINKVWYKIEDYVKGNFKGYITEFEGDYKLAQQWYGAKGKWFDCFEYPSNFYKEIKLEETKKEELYIQIGNSADPSNNHFEILEKLEKFKNQNIKLYCPLSYGNMEYAKKVIEIGKKIFKDNFIPLTEFMEYTQYLELLSKIDIAIFAHNRQQAFGNITSLLSMEKTVYLKDEITTTEMLRKLGVKIKSFNKLENLEVFDNEILEKNKNIMKERFSEKKLVEEWGEIFKEV